MSPSAVMDFIGRLLEKIYTVLLVLFISCAVALFLQPDLMNRIGLTTKDLVYIFLSCGILLLINIINNKCYKITQYLRDRQYRKDYPLEHNFKVYLSKFYDHIKLKPADLTDKELVEKFNSAAKNINPPDTRTVSYLRKKKLFDKNNQFTLHSFRILEEAVKYEFGRLRSRKM